MPHQRALELFEKSKNLVLWQKERIYKSSHPAVPYEYKEQQGKNRTFVNSRDDLEQDLYLLLWEICIKYSEKTYAWKISTKFICASWDMILEQKRVLARHQRIAPIDNL